jgi:mycothiol synthase
MRPPEGYSVRAATWDDLSRVGELMLAADLVDWGEVDFSEEFLRDDWTRPGFDLATGTWLVEDAGGQPVAYAWLLALDAHRQLDGWGVVHPEHRGRGVGTWLMDLVEAKGQEHAALAAPGERVTLSWGTIAPDRAAHELLERRGYLPVRYFWRMAIDLEEPAREDLAPEGVRIRPFELGLDDRPVYEAFEEAFQEHYGHVTRPYEEWRTHRIESEGFDPTLWFLAEEGGEVAGALAGGVMNGEGLVATLGVRRPWRGRGVGHALLMRSFRRFQDRGLSRVTLFVDGQNATGATALYEKAGMRVIRQYDLFQRELRPGEPDRPSSP